MENRQATNKWLTCKACGKNTGYLIDIPSVCIHCGIHFYFGPGVSEPHQSHEVHVELERKFDPVLKPKGYNSHPSGIECITIVEHMTYNVGCAVKYLWRYLEKGNPIEDLKKAIKYIEFEIARLEREGKK